MKAEDLLFADGYLWVADRNYNRILRYYETTFAYVDTFLSGLGNQPLSLAIAPVVASSGTPEPITLVLGAIGLALLSMLAWRRRRSGRE